MDVTQKIKKPVTPATLKMIEDLINQACQLEFAEITLVIKKGRLDLIRGPAPLIKINDNN